MIRNLLRSGLRHLLKHKGMSLISMVSLVLGLTCTFLILLWVRNELSYDRFHEDAGRISLVLRGDSKETTSMTSTMLAPALRQELPEVANATSFTSLPASLSFLVQNGGKGFDENISLAATNFFELFSFKFKEGIPATALLDPNSIVITEDVAKKYFGDDDAMGKTLMLSGLGQQRAVTVSGVLENMPLNSHIQSRVFLSIEWFKSLGINFDHWGDQSFNTYILVRDGANLQDLASQIKACEVRHFPDQNIQTLTYGLLPLTKIHLYGAGVKFLRQTGDIKYVQIFIAIAVIILLIAGINYMNLSTALSLRRAKEVGLKKSFGASRRALMTQFIGESLLLSFAAMGIALLLAWGLLPEFNRLSGKDLAIPYQDPIFIGAALMLTALTGLFSGGYPAAFLSSFQPAHIVRGNLGVRSHNLVVRKGLVVFQFALSIIMIVCTLVVFRQLSFVRSASLGFDKENIACIRMKGEANSKFDLLKAELQKDPDILSVSRSEPMNGSEWTRTTGVQWPGKRANEDKHFWVMHTDCFMESTFRIEMIQGRFFSAEFPTDQSSAFVINESAAQSMEMKSPLGEEIDLWGKKGRVIGVAKDFHFASFHSAIEPLIMTIPKPGQESMRFRMISIRFNAGTLNKSIAAIEKTWSTILPDTPFDCSLYDDSLNVQYAADQRMGTIFQYFALFSILIACLGLFGLASLSAQQRTKEVGIRKVLGASTAHTAIILSREFLVWVALSNIIAFPIAWYAMHRWLEEFAYRVGVDWWVFAFAGGLSLLIALLTVGTRAIIAASANPIEALRYE